MYEAFTAVTVLEKLPLRVESLLAHGDRLLIGTDTGVLLVYKIREPHGNEPLSVGLVDTKKEFAKKAIEQLDVIREADMLLSLSDSKIHIHRLSTLTYRDHLAKTAGASVFAVVTNFDAGPGGVPMIVTKLAVAVRRKLVVYTWQDAEFLQVKEYPIPERARTLSWASPDRICVGYSRNYTIISLPVGTTTDLFQQQAGGGGGGSLQSSLNSSLNSLNSLGTMGIAAMGIGAGSKLAKPLAVPLPQGELLVMKDSVGFFTDVNGVPKPKPSVQWSAVPEELSFSPPYFLGAISNTVEVRNIRNQVLVQTVLLDQPVRIITPGKAVYVASSDHIWRLLMKPFADQIRQLATNHEYEEAIGLFNQTEPNPTPEKSAGLRKIQRLYAHHLFATKNFDRAMALFAELDDVNPAEVIRLFPEAIAGSVNLKVDANGSADDQGESGDAHSALALSGAELDEAVCGLIRFLTEKRAKIIHLISSMQKNLHHAAGARDLASAALTDEQRITVGEAMDDARVVDTALLRAYLNTNDALVGPLLRVQNSCDVEECESLLLNKKKYRELVDFYYGKGLHRKSLQLLTKLAKATAAEESTTGSLFSSGPDAIINYLQRLSVDHFDLILEFSPWVLKNFLEAGLQIFIGDYSSAESLPREKVLRLLEQVSVDGRLAIRYLEHAIYRWKDEAPELHGRLIELYLDLLEAAGPGNASAEGTLETRTKLLKHLTESTSYKPERVLSRLPMEGMYEERAILLGRLGQHEQALHIYVHKIKDENRVEEYCRRHQGSCENVYLLLLRVYLAAPQGISARLESALALLTKYGAHISASEVLELMPPTVEMSRLKDYFTKYVRKSVSDQRMASVVKNLWESEQLKVHSQLVYYRSRRVRITEDRMCPRCNKKIGNSVFAVLPAGVVVHYSCARGANERPPSPALSFDRQGKDLKPSRAPGTSSVRSGRSGTLRLGAL